MPLKMQWSQLTDMQLHRLRNEGATWDAIAAALHLSRSAVIEHGRRIGACRPRPQMAPVVPHEPLDPAREALPAGHPISWQAITAGTLLAGTRYPPYERDSL